MEAHALLRSSSVSLLDPLKINLPRVMVHSPVCTTTFCCNLLPSAPSVTAPKREKDSKKRVVVTGMGVVSVFRNNVDTYYLKLLAGESGIGSIDWFDASKLPIQFGGQIHGFMSNGYIDSKLDRGLDDCQRYCIVAGKKALEHACLGVEELSKIDKEHARVLVTVSDSYLSEVGSSEIVSHGR